MRFLLDEHISPRVAANLKEADIDAVALRDFEGRVLLGASDGNLLLAARRHGRVMVTFDLRTINPLLKEMGEAGIDHSGVVLVDERGALHRRTRVR